MNIYLSLFISCVVIYFTRWLINIIRYRKIINKFPGRQCNFLFGDVIHLSLDANKCFLQFREYAKEFPDGYRMYAGQHGVFNFTIAEDVEVVLSSSKHLTKSKIYNFVKNWLGLGLLTSTGSKWVHRRKILTPGFHFNILRRFTTIFGEYSTKFTEQLQKECLEPKTNIVPLMTKLTLHIICETAMGITLNSYDKTMTDYQDATYGVSHMLYTRLARPWLYSDLIYNLTKYRKLERVNLKILHQLTTDVIKERDRTFNVCDLENLEQENEEWEVYSKKRLAMLDLLLLAKRSGEIDDDGIREEVNTFLFAGHDTVSMGLSFCLFMLANHKHVQEKVRAELDEIFKDSERPASFNDLKNMKYLEMCIKETLRIYPSVAVFSRYIDEDVKFRGGKYTIPAGCIARIHVYDLHRDARVFPDPEKFDPGRFLPENVKGRHPYAYIPFSAGPRNCIGQKFAMLEMKSLISAVLRRYEMDPVDKPENISLITDIVLRPKDGIHIKFKPRVR